jgi:hypothetical protein
VLYFPNVEIVDAADEIDFLFQGELPEHRVSTGLDRGARGQRRLRPRGNPDTYQNQQER